MRKMERKIAAKWGEHKSKWMKRKINETQHNGNVVVWFLENVWCKIENKENKRIRKCEWVS